MVGEKWRNVIKKKISLIKIKKEETKVKGTKREREREGQSKVEYLYRMTLMASIIHNPMYHEEPHREKNLNTE